MNSPETFCLFLHSGHILVLFSIFSNSHFTVGTILYRSQNWDPALPPMQTQVCQGQKGSSRLQEITDAFVDDNALNLFFPELLPLMTLLVSLTLSNSSSHQNMFLTLDRLLLGALQWHGFSGYSPCQYCWKRKSLSTLHLPVTKICPCFGHQ